jgi:ADP-ribose pyrophosphatase YjhB (NUDIX family)
MLRIDKVYAYITHGSRLLVFRHTRFPEAGLQVPGGTLEAGEAPSSGALREAEEESGLMGLRLRRFLGVQELDMTPYGLNQVHRRFFYHLELEGAAPETWIHDEMTPSDGEPAPIEYEFFWASLPSGVPLLAGGQGDMLYRLNAQAGES